jgi:hypothetical protein
MKRIALWVVMSDEYKRITGRRTGDMSAASESRLLSSRSADKPKRLTPTQSVRATPIISTPGSLAITGERGDRLAADHLADEIEQAEDHQIAAELGNKGDLVAD